MMDAQIQSIAHTDICNLVNPPVLTQRRLVLQIVAYTILRNR